MERGAEEVGGGTEEVAEQKPIGEFRGRLRILVETCCVQSTCARRVGCLAI